MFAKARYGRTIKGTKPKINQDGIIRLNQARHPLLSIEEAVANDVVLR